MNAELRVAISRLPQGDPASEIRELKLEVKRRKEEVQSKETQSQMFREQLIDAEARNGEDKEAQSAFTIVDRVSMNWFSLVVDSFSPII